MHDVPTPRPPVVSRLIQDAAARLGYGFRALDPVFGHLLEVSDGRRSIVLISGSSPVNTTPAYLLCKDKHYANIVLERAGVRTPATARCLSPSYFTRPDYEAMVGLDSALRLTESNAFPLIVKPNRMSHGAGVSVVTSTDEMNAAVELLWSQGSRVVLVQEFVAGRDFRLNFVGDEFVGGYERRQVVLRGDGKRSVHELLVEADARWADEGFVERLGDEIADLRLDAVLAAGERLPVGSDAILNLNQLATARVFDEIPDAWRRYCLGIGKALGAVHFGLDVKAPGLDHDPETLVVIEANGSPLLTGLYQLGYEELAITGQAKALQLAFDRL